MSVVKGVALITGSAQGIGRGIALRLANDGYDIALNDVLSKRDELRAVAGDIEQIGRRTLLVPADVSVEEEVKGMIQEVVKELGSLDVMIANAGIARIATLVSTELADWEQVMAINARGPFLCYKYAAQQMIKQGRGGRIIGASSIQGLRGQPFHAAYCASKFAIRGLTHSAAQELGRYNITVNCYAPGTIITEMSQTNDQKVQRLMEDGSSAIQSGYCKA
ncbi:acetoin reductase family protein [Chiua virens]|nr:acetoin reductase family protein [Chiua virens]